MLGLKVKAVDKPGIIPARNRVEHLEVRHKADEECSIRCGELQPFEVTRR